MKYLTTTTFQLIFHTSSAHYCCTPVFKQVEHILMHSPQHCWCMLLCCSLK